MMITRYLLAATAVAFAGAVAVFTAVALAGAAAAFGATASAPAAVAPPVPGQDEVTGPNRAATRAKLMEMDTDHDGRWSKAEWLAGGRNAKGFDRMDTNHDGYLTPDELRTGMAAMRAARVQDMPLPPMGGAPE